jgi:hypothetical protein
MGLEGEKFVVPPGRAGAASPVGIANGFWLDSVEAQLGGSLTELKQQTRFPPRRTLKRQVV